MNVIGLLAYGFMGIGKFAVDDAAVAAFDADPDCTNENLYGLIITALTSVYVVKGGMVSVVFTEVMQFVVMTRRLHLGRRHRDANVSPEMLARDGARGVGSIRSSVGKLDLDWTRHPRLGERRRSATTARSGSGISSG